MGVSLWIVPPNSDPVTSELVKIITAVSQSRSSPNFSPHITLASLPECISLEEITVCLHAAKGPIAVNLKHVRTGDTYFQSVFITVEASEAMLGLHKHVHKALGVQPKTPEFPHLSLYYGIEDKAQIADESSLMLKAANISGFLADEIWIVDCEGKPESWVILEKISL